MLTNPESDGNRSDLTRVRDFCDGRPEIFHNEVRHPDEVADAVAQALALRPQVLVINGGDGTVQSVLTRLLESDDPASLPPITVLPNGKTNLIAKDLSSTGDPVRALDRALELARTDFSGNIVSRQLIRLDAGGQTVHGMFLAAGALEEVILFCRHKIYPLGLSNGVAHLLTLFLGLIAALTRWNSRFLPPQPAHVSVTVGDHPPLHGRFQVLMVTTLRRLVLTGKAPQEKEGMLQLLAVERRRRTSVMVVFATLIGKLGQWNIRGVHLKMGESIRIDDERTGVLMDGELFAPVPGKPIVLTPTRPLRFLDLGVGHGGPDDALLSEPR